MCLTPVWFSAPLRIWPESTKVWGSPTFWVFGCWSPCVPPSDASSWSSSSHGGLDRAGWRVSFIKGMAFPSVITSLCLQFLPHGPLLLSDQPGSLRTGSSVLDLAPTVSPAHKPSLSSPFLPPAAPLCHLPPCPPRLCVFTAAAGVGSSPRKRAVKLQFSPDQQQSSKSNSSLFLPASIQCLQCCVGELSSGFVVVSWKEFPTLPFSSNQHPTSLILVPS